MKARYAAIVGFCVALAMVHAILAFWTPIQGDDWNHWIWAGQHRTDDSFALSWLGAHASFADAIGYVLARCRNVHVLISPMVMVALVVGLFVLAMRRWPRPTWDDILGLALVSTLLWIGQPAAGVTLFHTPSVALYVYGAAAAAWFAVPLRCGWTPPRAVWPLLAVLGYCAGSSARTIGALTLIGTLLALRAMPRAKRQSWMWIALGGLVVGVIVGYATPPWIEFSRVFRRGLEANLTGQGLLRYAVQETGEIVAFVVALGLLDVALRLFRRPHAADDGRPDPTDTLRWLLGAFATAIWALFGPKYNEATLFPVTCLLVVGALPYLVWLATARFTRIVLVVVAIAVHAITWSTMLAKYHKLGTEGFARMTALEATPKGQIAYVPRFSQTGSDFWFMGEDLWLARLRSLVAIEAFDARDIVLDPAFRRYEPSPNIELALEVDNASDTERKAAHEPAVWATELSAARKQFEIFTKRLRANTGRAISARLVVKNVVFDQRGTRPLLAAWVDAHGTMIPRIARSPLDENSQYTIRIYPPDSRQFNEAWIIDDGIAVQTQYHGGSTRLQPLFIRLQVVVACNKDRCLAADAFLPRL